MGRAGLEPATLGLKVLHFLKNSRLEKRRFRPLFMGFSAVGDTRL
jgi:hypothetical protein